MSRRRGDRGIDDDEARLAARRLRDEAPAPPAGLDARVLAAVARERDATTPAVSARRPLRRPARVAGLVVAATVLLLLVGLAVRPGGESDEARAVSIVPLTGECTAGDPTRLEVAGVWHGAEARRFAQVLHGFERRTGVTVTYAYNTRNIAAVLDARIARGCAPDVAILPQPGLLTDLARRGRLQALDRATAAVVRAGYAAPWRRLGTVDGRLYGVWFKAADKSTLWYRPEALRAAGVSRPPRTWGDLLETARRIAATGRRPIALAGGSPWTLTDWFENLYLNSAGPRPYSLLAAHRIPWTDPTVLRVLRQLATLFGDSALVGPSSEALETSFERSVAQVFGPRPQAAMVYEGDFVRGFLPRTDPGRTGAQATFVAFPGGAPGDRNPPTRAAVVGGDVAVQLDRGPAARKLLRYLATPEAAEPWARAGGFISPGRRVPLDAYPDALTRRAAAALAHATTVRFDLSDLQPPAFGSTARQGMWAIFQDFLADPRRVKATALRLEEAAAAAWACERAVAGRC